MTETEKRIAIAEVCGWKPRLRESGETCWFKNNKGGMATKPEHLPDYFNDLNAMHEAETSALNSRELRNEFSEWLFSVVSKTTQIGNGSYWTEHATATQRAEAFGLTLELWK